MEIKVNLTPIVSTILKEFLRPYNDLLTQMVEDGRLTKEELAVLRQKIMECGESLATTLRKGLDQQDGWTATGLDQQVVTQDVVDEIEKVSTSFKPKHRGHKSSASGVHFK